MNWDALGIEVISWGDKDATAGCNVLFYVWRSFFYADPNENHFNGCGLKVKTIPPGCELTNKKRYRIVALNVSGTFSARSCRVCYDYFPPFAGEDERS